MRERAGEDELQLPEVAEQGVAEVDMRVDACVGQTKRGRIECATTAAGSQRRPSRAKTAGGRPVCGVGRAFGSTCSELQHQLGTNRQGGAERREELDEERAGDEADLRCGAAQPFGGGQRQMQVGHDEPRPADRASGSGAVPGAKGGKMALPR